MIPIALGLLLSFVSAAYDYDKTFKDHRLRWGFRCVATTLFAFIGGHTFILYMTNALVIATVFYATFDYLLNILAGRKWSYIGDTAKLDKLKKAKFSKNLVGLDLLTKLSFLLSAIMLKLFL